MRQQSQIPPKNILLSDDVKITCLNASDLNWEIALNNLVEMGNGNLLSRSGNCYLTLNELMRVGEILQDTSALSFDDLSHYLPDQFINQNLSIKSIFNNQIRSHFKVLIVSKRIWSYIINIYQLSFEVDLDTLFENSEINHSDVTNAPHKELKPSDKGGRKSLTSLIPGLVGKITNFIKSQEFKVQAKCREESVTSYGVSLDDIRSYVMNKLPILRHQPNKNQIPD